MPILAIALLAALLFMSGDSSFRWGGSDPVPKPPVPTPPIVPPNVQSDADTYLNALQSVGAALETGAKVYQTLSQSTVK